MFVLFADPEVPQTVLVETAVLMLGARLDIAVLVVVLLEGAAIIEDEVNAEATDAEPGVVSSLEPFIHVHFSPHWTMGRKIAIIAMEEVASVFAFLLQFLTYSAVNVGPTFGVKRELSGENAVGSPAIVEVIRGGAESPTASADFSPALIS